MFVINELINVIFNALQVVDNKKYFFSLYFFISIVQNYTIQTKNKQLGQK